MRDDCCGHTCIVFLLSKHCKILSFPSSQITTLTGGQLHFFAGALSLEDNVVRLEQQLVGCVAQVREQALIPFFFINLMWCKNFCINSTHCKFSFQFGFTFHIGVSSLCFLDRGI